MSARYRLGIDIGGTFTDATLLDKESGEVTVDKVSSTPHDPSIGFLEASLSILNKASVDPKDIEFVVHATTVATNSIIEGKLAPTGFVTTGGFSDMLELARQMRPSLYDLRFEKPRALVPRERCFGVAERLDARGAVLVELDEEALRHVADGLRQKGIESVAVCFLHSYVNPAHERRAGEILHELLPDVVISLSAEVAREFREYYRATTTVINAAVAPIVSKYLESIVEKLRGVGLQGELLIMQSNGGVYTANAARERPVFMVESGPAAGVIAATYLGGALGYPNVISFDMGGTTAKACLIQGGTPRVTKDYEVGGKAAPGTGSARGSGFPIRTPVIDLVEIGAGGGSIAWVDAGGILRVGPQSAGADPGPVCYRRGGTQPTITDANLVLGRLNPDYFLGGGVRLDIDAARAAIDDHCARKLGLDVIEAANGIVEIANTAMVNALRLVSVQHGYDPRDFVLIAFGGAGPLHANRLADETGIGTTLIPLSAGTTSAMGLLVTDLKREYTTTMIQRAADADLAALKEGFEDLESQGRLDLTHEGVAPEEMAFARQIDMRYVGQSYELTINAPAGELSSREITAVVTHFNSEHERAYGHSAEDEPVEFVNLRVTATGMIAKPRLRKIGANGNRPDVALKTHRSVYFAEAGAYVDCPIFDRYQLNAGAVVIGPAIVEEFDTTTVVHPGYHATVDAFGNLLLTGSGEGASRRGLNQEGGEVTKGDARPARSDDATH
jgi:N-methylhydantoinase A